MTEPSSSIKTVASASKPLLSILIPCKNEAPTLPLALESLAIQEADFAFEVIFADGCSTDNSAEIIRQHALNQKAAVSVMALPPESHGMTDGWSAAAKVACGAYLLFMQSDVRIRDTHALKKVVATFGDPEVVATSFTEVQADAEFAAYDFWGQVFHARHLGKRDENEFDDKFNAVRREVYERIGGFDVEHFALGGEQFDLRVRLLEQGEIRDAGVLVEHLHGLGKRFSPIGMLKKYCRNAEVNGVTTPLYWKHRDIEPGFMRELILRLVICGACVASLLPWLWPWSALLVFALGIAWNRAAFLRIRDWRLIYVPLFSFAALYCFAFYFLRGLLFRKTSFQFDNKMR